MRIIGYILTGFSVFLIGLAVYLRVKDDKERQFKINASTAKAREAKAEKALIEKMKNEQMDLKSETEDLLNKTSNNNASKEETIER